MVSSVKAAARGPRMGRWLAFLFVWCTAGTSVAARGQDAADAEPPPVTASLPPGPLPIDLTSASAAGASVTLVDGTQLQGKVLQYVAGEKLVLEHEGQRVELNWAELRRVQFDPATPRVRASIPTTTPADPAVAAPDPMREHELTQLRMRRKLLRAGNRRWGPPAGGVILGVALTFTGAGALFWSGVVESSSDCFFPEDDCESPALPSFRAGVALLTIGPAFLLVFTPMLITRATRASRLRRVDAALARLGETLSLAPTFSPSGYGLVARARF